MIEPLLSLVLFLSQAAAGTTPSHYTVRGRVVDANPEHPVTPFPQRVLAMAETGMPSPISATVMPDGTFEISNVAPGGYVINTDRVWGQSRFDVRDQDVENVEIRAAMPIPSTIHVAMEDGSPLPVFPRGAFRITERIEGTMMSGTTGQDGVGTPLLIPGENDFFLLPPAGYFVTSMRWDEVDLLKSPLILKPSLDHVDIEAKISRTPPNPRPTVKVNGHVTGEHPGMEIRLVALGINASDVYRTVVGADGRFEFTGVGPGIYKLAAPPASNIVSNIVALGKDAANIEVQLPQGVIVAGQMSKVVLDNGVASPLVPGEISIQFTSAATSKRIRFASNVQFFDGLPSGSYRVSIEDLPVGYSVQSISAGTVNLLNAPMVIDGKSVPPEIQFVLHRATPANNP